MITISLEDREKIRKFENVMKKGWYANDGQVVELLNRLLDKRERPSSCASCCKRHITMLVDALNAVEREEAQNKAMETPPEALKTTNPITTPSDENKSILDDTSTQNKPKKGRPSKK